MGEVTLPPINMEPDKGGVLEDNFPVKGNPLSGSMLVGGRVVGRGTFTLSRSRIPAVCC